MSATFKRNPRWDDEVRRSPEVRVLRHRAATEVAREAERIGKSVSKSYRTEVDEQGDQTRVNANTEGINSASWIEIGTGGQAPTPAYAPLRKAVDLAGLKLTGGKR